MVAIMWLTGGKKPPTPAKTRLSRSSAQAPLEVNETKINELQNRIEELQREQLVAQSALAQQTRLLGGAPQDSQQAQQQSASGNPPDQRAGRPDPGGTEEARLRVAVCLECRSDLPQNSVNSADRADT